MRAEILRARGTGRAALDEVRQHPDRERLASAMAIGVSEPMIAWARRVVRFGSDELVAAVESGQVALYMAARVSRWSVEKQLTFLRLARTPGEGCTLTQRCIATLGVDSDDGSAVPRVHGQAARQVG